MLSLPPCAEGRLCVFCWGKRAVCVEKCVFLVFDGKERADSSKRQKQRVLCALCCQGAYPTTDANTRSVCCELLGRLIPMVSHAQAWLEMLLLWVAWGCTSIPPNNSPSRPTAVAEVRLWLCRRTDGGRLGLGGGVASLCDGTWSWRMLWCLQPWLSEGGRERETALLRHPSRP